MQVRALYDFVAQPGSGELNLKAGELLTVTKQDIGDGWWEGVNQQGQHGLFPASYVEQISTGGPPAMPPPPLPDDVVQVQSQQSTFREPNVDNGFGSTTDTFQDTFNRDSGLSQRSLSIASGQKYGAQSSASGGADEFDEDFSDEGESTMERAEPGELTLESTARPVATGGGGVKKSINRFSKFVQSGMEAFILNQVKLSSPPHQEMFEITMTKYGPIWTTNLQNQYTCRLGSYKKASKMKGLKSFINYDLTPSFAPNSSVERRYKHFEWLYSRLEKKFDFMLLSTLPERQVGGRSEDLVEHRMQLLQMWIDKICRHPVMSRADVWMHFLTTPPDGKEWKNGKRKAEKDQYIGGNFFFAVSAPNQQLDPGTVEQRFDVFSRKAKALEDAVGSASVVASQSIKHVCGPMRNEFVKYANAFRTLSQAMLDETGVNNEAAKLANALGTTGEKYDAVAKMCAEQPRIDLEPLIDQLFVYKGVLKSVPKIVDAEKNVLSRFREHQKLAEDGKMAPAELEAIKARVDTVSYALLAETNHFELEHVRDMKCLARDFLKAQVIFFENIRKELQEAEQLFS